MMHSALEGGIRPKCFFMSFLFFLQGSLDDHAGLVAAIKEVDVVISTVGGPAIPEQEKIIAAIKEAGNVLVHTLYTHTLRTTLYTLHSTLSQKYHIIQTSYIVYRQFAFHIYRQF